MNVEDIEVVVNGERKIVKGVKVIETIECPYFGSPTGCPFSGNYTCGSVPDLCYRENEITFINLTPHQITVFNDNNEKILEVPPSGIVARVKTEYKVVKEICGIPIVKLEYGELENVPEPMNNTYFIVSMLVKDRMKELGYTNVLSPDTSPGSAVRDEQGRIIGVRRLQI